MPSRVVRSATEKSLRAATTGGVREQCHQTMLRPGLTLRGSSHGLPLRSPSHDLEPAAFALLTARSHVGSSQRCASEQDLVLPAVAGKGHMRFSRAGAKHPTTNHSFAKWLQINDESINKARRAAEKSKKLQGLAAIGGDSKIHFVVGDPYADFQKDTTTRPSAAPPAAVVARRGMERCVAAPLPARAQCGGVADRPVGVDRAPSAPSPAQGGAQPCHRAMAAPAVDRAPPSPPGVPASLLSRANALAVPGAQLRPRQPSRGSSVGGSSSCSGLPTLGQSICYGAAQDSRSSGARASIARSASQSFIGCRRGSTLTLG